MALCQMQFAISVYYYNYYSFAPFKVCNDFAVGIPCGEILNCCSFSVFNNNNNVMVFLNVSYILSPGCAMLPHCVPEVVPGREKENEWTPREYISNWITQSWRLSQLQPKASRYLCHQGYQKMLEVNNHFSDSGKGIILYCVGEEYDVSFFKPRQYKVYIQMVHGFL